MYVAHTMPTKPQQSVGYFSIKTQSYFYGEHHNEQIRPIDLPFNMKLNDDVGTGPSGWIFYLTEPVAYFRLHPCETTITLIEGVHV